MTDVYLNCFWCIAIFETIELWANEWASVIRIICVVINTATSLTVCRDWIVSVT